MTEIKFCGLTREHDIHHASQNQADHLGLVVHAPKSHRNLDPNEARTLAQTAKGEANTVLVTVTQDHETIQEALDTVNPDILQLPNNEDPPAGIVDDHGARLWLALGLEATPKETVDAIEDALSVADRIVLDALKGGYGGHGEALDWGTVSCIIEQVPQERVVLAGGLTAENVADAIKLVDPCCVDVSSGIETDGVNNPARMRAFAQAVRGEVSA